ncbi:hypothetical protein BH23CHL7_BH23CHL7_04390 [soil metagenome]
MEATLSMGAFARLVDRLAAAWAAPDAVAAADCFTADATYIEPPAEQLFRGRDQLLAYFSALQPGTYLDIHGLWLDEAGRRGAIEFSFGVRGSPTADHGVAIVQLSNGLISSWREYVRQGPADFAEFCSSEGKQWAWHIGNYP